MSYRLGLLTGAVGACFALAAAWAAWSLVASPLPAQKAGASHTPPATMTKPLKEELLNVMTLTPEALARLAIRTAPIELRPMRPVRIYGGEVVPPPGQTVVVSAPLSGQLKAIPSGAVFPGKLVRRGQPVYSLLPLLTPEGRANLTAAKVDADGQLKTAETQVEAARIALERAKRVFQSEAGSKRMVDEAQALYDVARQGYDATLARRDLLVKVVGDVELGTAAPLVIECPVDGLLRSLTALPGQIVPAGAPLFEIIDTTPVWVRTPVFVGDLGTLDLAADARVGPLVAKTGDERFAAPPAAAPPSANPTLATADVFYELDNVAPGFRPGERVSVEIRLVGEAESLTAPWSAVVWDIYGGAWVYEQTGERTFVRRRVTVSYVTESTAVLTSGPAAGTRVVTAGAAELFGAEAGFTK